MRQRVKFTKEHLSQRFNRIVLDLGQRQKGQVLIETTIALGILIVGVLASYTLALSSVSSSGQSNQKLLAVNLAREGLDIIRAIRDSGMLDQNQSWPYGLADGSFLVDSDDSALTQPANNISQGTLYLTSGGVYTHEAAGNTPTPFRRLITISSSGGAAIKIIVSTVEWDERGQVKNFSLETHLSDWRQF